MFGQGKDFSSPLCTSRMCSKYAYEVSQMRTSGAAEKHKNEDKFSTFLHTISPPPTHHYKLYSNISNRDPKVRQRHDPLA